MTDFSSLERSHGDTFGGGPVLDAATIAGLQDLGGEDDPGLLLELIDLFLEDAEERVNTIQEAIAKDDIETVGKMAHALKSASANLGALGFSESCRTLELTAREGSQPVGDLTKNTCEMYGEVRDVLNQLRQEAS